MLVIDAKEVHQFLPYPDLVAALKQIYSEPSMAAHRHLHYMPELSKDSGTCMATMPAWGPGHDIVTKVFTAFPDNAAQGLPTVQALVLLFDGETGAPKAIVDGTALTLRRTASMSALATDLLACNEARNLLVCGSGALSPHAALAHASVRPIEKISIWARRPEAAADVVTYLRTQRPEIDIQVAGDLATAARQADIVSGQTSAKDPIVFGQWIRPGTHTDFVGSHSPAARECDDALVAKAKVYVDVMETALKEAGDLIIPLNNGSITKGHILGDFQDLCRRLIPGRESAEEITLYKSTGSALADLAAAELLVNNVENARPS